MNSFGEQLRTWRARRRLSQLSLALEAGVSARHVSFLESGRARPSRDMVLTLGAALEMPLRAQNVLLSGAGFAPAFRESSLDDERLAPVATALRAMMQSHSPLPAVLFDRYWNVLDANDSGKQIVGIKDTSQPINLVRLFLEDPQRRATILNWPEVAQAMRTRLITEKLHRGGDSQCDELIALIDSLGTESRTAEESAETPVVVVRIDAGGAEIRLFSTIVQIGTPQDVTLDELKLELFFPADEATARAFGVAPPGGVVARATPSVAERRSRSKQNAAR